jgi:hypothetical protein
VFTTFITPVPNTSNRILRLFGGDGNTMNDDKCCEGRNPQGGLDHRGFPNHCSMQNVAAPDQQVEGLNVSNAYWEYAAKKLGKFEAGGRKEGPRNCCAKNNRRRSHSGANRTKLTVFFLGFVSKVGMFPEQTR